jgi:hypothetical protein
MIIECYRNAGDRVGAPIIELMLSDDALIHRGRAEMDANAHELNRTSLSIVPRNGVRLGQIIEASDPSSATPYRGKITGMSISISDADVTQVINIEVPI